jgi:hypothetical protein
MKYKIKNNKIVRFIIFIIKKMNIQPFIALSKNAQTEKVLEGIIE